MEPRPPSASPSAGAGLALAGLGALAAIMVLGALLDLGPFAEEELTRAEFLAQGDQLCRAAHQAFSELQADPPQTPAEAAELTDRLVGIASEERERIAALEPPPELAPLVEEYLAARERGIGLLERGREAASDGNAAGYAEAQEDLLRSQRERLRIAREIGFGECSRPISSPGG